MNRRDSLKAISLGTLTTGLLLSGCKTDNNKLVEETAPKVSEEEEAGRLPGEIERDKKLNADKFFTSDEMAAITLLADIIIPKDEKSGSASDAKVPDFIEFIVKDRPEHKTPMRGGLRWLDLQCLKRFGHPFKECSHQQQIEMVTEIAYPLKAKPEMQQGVAFFNRMRDLTASGFFTTQIGLKDLGYVGNSPTKWEGVPADVLKQYGFKTVWG